MLLLEGEPDALEQVVARAGLELSGEDRPTETADPTNEIGVIEAWSARTPS